MNEKMHVVNRSVPFCCALVAPMLVVGIRGQQASVVVLVSRAADYVHVFMERFSHVVAEEHYGQSVKLPAATQPQRRELVADFLLVKTDETADRMAFRDVFEVDKVAVRDRDERLTKLFLEAPSTARAHAEATSRESARYNIGTPRTANNPLLPLAFLQDRYRSRFSFSLDRPERIDGMDVSVVAYREVGHPTLIRGTAGRDISARGRYWIDATGRVLKAEMSTSDYIVRSKITVTFQFDERFQVCVPVVMDEEYATMRQTTKATARYGRFREFVVQTEETAR